MPLVSILSIALFLVVNARQPHHAGEGATARVGFGWDHGVGRARSSGSVAHKAPRVSLLFSKSVDLDLLSSDDLCCPGHSIHTDADGLRVSG